MSAGRHVPAGYSADLVTGSRALAIARFGLDSGVGFPTHTHTQHQLTWAQSGVLRLEAAGRTWVLPSSLAVWIPAELPHAVVARGRTLMTGIYLDPATVRGQAPSTWIEPTVVAVGDLMSALIRYLAEEALEPAARERAQAVLLDVLTPVSVTTVAVPVPTDDRLLKIAALLDADPADTRTLSAFGKAAGASERTLARLFVAETGMTFARWRTQTRLRRALELLADGLPVATVAHRVGYGSASAFVAMFRQLTGATPGALAALPEHGEGGRDRSRPPSVLPQIARATAMVPSRRGPAS